MLRDISEAENLSHLNAQVYDIQDANLSEMYDFIGCTVTLMFLNPATVAEVIANMQEHTRQGGYNVIVCAMDTAQYPCPMPFPFTFKEGQLKAARSEEHTSELQSRGHIVCRLLRETNTI